MRINMIAYAVAKQYVGQEYMIDEVINPRVEIMRFLTCLRATQENGYWHSPFVNFCVLIANYMRNPKPTELMLKDMAIKPEIIDWLKGEAQKLAPSLGLTVNPELVTTEPIIQPTWSVWGNSWLCWGHSSKRNPQPGDIAVLTGNYVGFLHEDSRKGYYSVLGAHIEKVKYKMHPEHRLLDVRSSRT